MVATISNRCEYDISKKPLLKNNKPVQTSLNKVPNKTQQEIGGRTTLMNREHEMNMSKISCPAIDNSKNVVNIYIFVKVILTYLFMCGVVTKR